MAAKSSTRHEFLTIYSDNELALAATIRKFRLVQTDGSRRIERLVDFYSLDVTLVIGYRVRSHRGGQFRRWATERLRRSPAGCSRPDHL